METPLNPTLCHRAEKAGWKLGRVPTVPGYYYEKDGHPRCEDGGVIWDQAELEEILDADDEPDDTLSNCCGAPPLGEIHNSFAPCSDCKEMAEFREGEE